MHPSLQEPPCNRFRPSRVVGEMRVVWACLTEELGELAEGHQRMRVHIACGEPGTWMTGEELLEVLRHRMAGSFLLLRECVRECAAARGLGVDEYLAEKGASLALMAEQKFGGVG